MNLLDRYIAKIILFATFIVLIAILSLDSFISFIRYSNQIGQGSFTVYSVFQFVLLTIPSRIYIVFPFAVLIGTLMGLSYLNSNSEIIAMRTAGISTNRIIFSVLKLGIVLSLFLFIIGEYVSPLTQKIAQREKNIAIYDNLTLDIKNEVWIRDNSTYTNIRSIQIDKSLSGIKIYNSNPDGSLKYSMNAKRAVFDGQDWVLQSVQQTIFNPDHLQIETYPNFKWQTPFNLDLVDIITTKVASLSILDLYRYTQYLDQNNIDSKVYHLKFWQKIVAPFTLMVMLVLAFPFALSHSRSGKMEEKLFIGIVLGLLFYMADKIAAEFTLVFNFPPLISATFLSIITLILSLFALKKVA